MWVQELRMTVAICCALQVWGRLEDCACPWVKPVSQSIKDPDVKAS